MRLAMQLPPCHSSASTLPGRLSSFVHLLGVITPQNISCHQTTKGKTMAVDVLIVNHGSVALFTPMTPDAHQWVEEHVCTVLFQRIWHKAGARLSNGLLAG
jgi:hypothetical protein